MENLVKKIEELKKREGAIILAHIYQSPDVQDIADFTGDSLELAKFAAGVKENTIVFCGVYFMAETAAIINPGKNVLLPDKTADCPMARMVCADQVRRLKQENPDAKVVCYINSTAQVKAESDICCTSSNAQKVVDSLDCEKIIFVPDQYLGRWTAKRSKKNFIFTDGFCPVHMKFIKEKVLKLKNDLPDSIAMCHPECHEDIKDVCDFVLSTGQMARKVKESENKNFIIATEEGIMHKLKKENPYKKFYYAQDSVICRDMKKINLKKIVDALNQPEKFKITLREDISNRARKCINRMLKL